MLGCAFVGELVEYSWEKSVGTIEKLKASSSWIQAGHNNLKITNIQLTDEGRYRCWGKDKRNKIKQSTYAHVSVIGMVVILIACQETYCLIEDSFFFQSLLSLQTCCHRLSHSSLVRQ